MIKIKATLDTADVNALVQRVLLEYTRAENAERAWKAAEERLAEERRRGRDEMADVLRMADLEDLIREAAPQMEFCGAASWLRKARELKLGV